MGEAEFRVHEAKITALFNKFAGKTLTHPAAMGIDPVLVEMEKTARDNGLTLRIAYDGLTDASTPDFDMARVNIRTKFTGGQFVIQKKMTVG